jgi:CBS-domain-containing membrane protein
MKTMSKPLSRLTAADLMTPDVTAIPRHLSLRQAAHLLSQARISGAPVVDGCGACVGVISATDFVHYAQGQCPVRREEAHGDLCSDWQMYEEEALPTDAVSSYMTPDPVTAMPTTRVTELARMMLDAHIHRVIIIDARRCPVGVVSSTDILAAVAYGGRE